MNGLTLRTATPKDRDVLIQFETGLQAMEAEMNPLEQLFSQADAARYVDWVCGSVEKNNGLCLIAEKDGKSVGFTAGWIEDNTEDDALQLKPEYRSYGYIAEGYVAPNYRKQGIYSALVGQLEKYFCERGVRWIRRNTLAQNQPLLAVAHKQGYAPYLVTLAKEMATSNA